MSDLQNRNNAAIQNAINALAKENSDLKLRMQLLENNLTILKAELATQKQLTAHVLGRGMGSTVHN